MSCSQCSKPAVFMLEDKHPLCVDCWAKVQNVLATQMAQNMAMMNLAAEEMDFIAGFGRKSPRVQIPIPTHVHRGTVYFHNIRVDRSIVGAINTGEVQSIDVALDRVRQITSEPAADALRVLTEAVLTERSLSDAAKRELIEQVSFLTHQATLKPEEQKQGMIQARICRTKGRGRYRRGDG